MVSRRQFLKLTGVALASSQVALRFPQIQAVADNTIYGRALVAAPVYSRSSVDSALISHLWPDSITPIMDVQDGWYRAADGYIQRQHLQPVAAYSPSAFHTADQPFWAEVTVPAASLRAYCAADAPLVSRIGHGGVGYVVDHLPDEQGGWFAVADEGGTILGWSQAIHWQPVEIEFSGSSTNELEIDLNNQQLTAWENGHAVLQAPVSTNPNIIPGQYTVDAGIPGQMHFQAANWGIMQGVPWVTKFGDNLSLGGVYWHNRFGQTVPGMAVQVTPLVARWLYGWLNETSEIRVI